MTVVESRPHPQRVGHDANIPSLDIFRRTIKGLLPLTRLGAFPVVHGGEILTVIRDLDAELVREVPVSGATERGHWSGKRFGKRAETECS